ncbi:DUF427 domain-containing protein [Rhizobium sp. H4]|uniref:DUF427 domain-containing protein n=1 Tax=Rhizobium sp. H4 TaxID=2035449 RepID=UPI000D0F3790|nr:DUF427 domain-containing protein [Rhizobium sp. H4]
MSDKSIKIPGPDHPITVEHNPCRVVVTLGGRTIADSRDALTLREASLLQRTDHRTHCPYKGDAAYYSIIPGGERAENAVWTYEVPNAAVSNIKGHLAFYPDRVDSIEEMASPEAGTF